MGRNKYIQCKICLKKFRSDNIKRHEEQHHTQKSKYQMKSCSICQKSMIAWHLSRHMKIHNNSEKQILEYIKSDQKCYDDVGNTGKILTKLLDKEDINPLSLRSEHLKALEVNSLRKEEEFDSLKPWQEQLLKLIETSDREIIWVCGKTGAEGKSWFQKYLEHYYTPKRVFRSPIDKNKESILHSLSKKTISLIDVFIFNIPRSFNVDDVPFTLLEDIKDGFAMSTKYNSKSLQFKTPNIVILFSNTLPNKKKVSLDRWNISQIMGDNLINLCYAVKS